MANRFFLLLFLVTFTSLKTDKILYFNNKKLYTMRTLLIYRRLLIQAYTSEEISAMILNLYIALADNDLQDIKSIIERFEITYEEIEQIQTLTNRLLTSN